MFKKLSIFILIGGIGALVASKIAANVTTPNQITVSQPVCACKATPGTEEIINELVAIKTTLKNCQIHSLHKNVWLMKKNVDRIINAITLRSRMYRLEQELTKRLQTTTSVAERLMIMKWKKLPRKQ